MENLQNKNRIVLRIQQQTHKPWHWIPNDGCERTQAFFKFLGKESIPPEEIEGIVRMKFDIELLEVPEAPVVTTFEVFSEYFIWRDFERNRYAGLRRSQTPGSGYYNIKAFSRDRGTLTDRLFGREPIRKMYERTK